MQRYPSRRHSSVKRHPVAKEMTMMMKMMTTLTVMIDHREMRSKIKQRWRGRSKEPGMLPRVRIRRAKRPVALRLRTKSPRSMVVVNQSYLHLRTKVPCKRQVLQRVGTSKKRRVSRRSLVASRNSFDDINHAITNEIIQV